MGRVASAITSAVGCPIRVEGRIWGLIASLSTGPDPQPATTEARITEFTELLASAIADAENRTEGTVSCNSVGRSPMVLTAAGGATPPFQVVEKQADLPVVLQASDESAVVALDTEGEKTPTFAVLRLRHPGPPPAPPSAPKK